MHERQDGHPARIFVVDDHPVFRLGLAALLRGEEGLEICGDADEPKAALSRIEQEHPDLVIVDISLKESSGLLLIKQIKTQWSSMVILALSMHDELLFAERALRAGATGYLSKNSAPQIIIEGIRRALRGEVVMSSAMADMLLRRVIRSGVESNSSISGLSDRELEIFELMGRGLRTRQVAERLHISVKTVETHQGSIKNKLGIQSVNELLRLAVSWVAGIQEDQR